MSSVDATQVAIDAALRYNTGKPRIGLITGSFLRGLGGVLTFGAKKYDDWNWIKSKDTEEHDAFRNGCVDSLLRHATALMDGELIDPDSGLPHVYHIACNTMFIAEYDNYDL